MLQVGWYIPGRIVYVRIPEPFTYEVMEESNRQIVRLLDEGTPMVHLLVDVLDVKTFPVNILKIREIYTLLAHPGLGWTVVVTSNPMLRFLATAVPQLGDHTRATSLPTLAEGVKFLHERDETLDWSTADEALLVRNSESESK